MVGRRSISVREFTFRVTVNTITVNTSVPKVQFPNICGDKQSKQSLVNMLFFSFRIQNKGVREYISLFLCANPSNPKDTGTVSCYYKVRGDSSKHSEALKTPWLFGTIPRARAVIGAGNTCLPTLTVL